MPKRLLNQEIRIGRRCFLGAASGYFASGLFANRTTKMECFAAEVVSSTSGDGVTRSARRAPLLLNQRTLPQTPLANILRSSKSLGFDGIELALSSIIAEARLQRTSVSDVVKSAIAHRQDKGTPRNEHSFLTCLAVDLDQGPTRIDDDINKQLNSILEHVDLSHCSIAISRIAAFDNERWSMIREIVERLRSAKNVRTISVENPILSSPVGAAAFLEGFKQLPEGIGLLIRSSEMRMRLDMGLQEIRFLLSEMNEQGVSTKVHGIRLEVNTSSTSIRDVNYQRELFRKALSEQVISSGDNPEEGLFRDPDAFVSLEAAQPLNTTLPNNSEMKIDSAIFNDIFAVLASDVLKPKQ